MPNQQNQNVQIDSQYAEELAVLGQRLTTIEDVFQREIKEIKNKVQSLSDDIITLLTLKNVEDKQFHTIEKKIDLLTTQITSLEKTVAVAQVITSSITEHDRKINSLEESRTRHTVLITIMSGSFLVIIGLLVKILSA